MSLKDKYKKKFNHDSYKQELEEEDKNLNNGKGGDKDFIKLKPGLNYLRIFPTTNPSKFYVAKKQSWLYAHSDKDDKLTRRTVLNAVFHGSLKKDPVEEYIKYVLNVCVPRIEEEEGAKEAQKIKSVIKDYKQTPSPQTIFLCYAYHHDNPKETDREKFSFGLFEFKASVKDGLTKIIDDIEEEEDDTLEFNPISDPEDGKWVKIKYDDKATQAADYYTVSLAKNKLELDEDDLELLESKEDLLEMYGRDIYTAKDLDFAIECISAFEEFHKWPEFSGEEDFIDIIEEIKEELKTKNKGKKVVGKKTSKSNKNDDEEDDEEEDEKRLSKKRKVDELIKKQKNKQVHQDEEEDGDEEEEEDEEEEYKSRKKKEIKKKVDEVSKKSNSKNKYEDDDEEEDEEDDDDEIPSFTSFKKKR